ncbi:adenosylcobinamide-phosphate synthase CbiB [Planococcus liqunii]|uniref:Cobalamin biosynthesis protein CobD n=1 Tax=Planococcus liqunii TaxID=3058394 RepID=A0ABT8MP05_9BACL|nr:MULTISPECIES: adenosylcobinamide-phosphate synthase CbiB [unclassified Planococcus (in: firmicutes)]MDN7226558.1 adenosylcobinamide-phosphate synthase CbiB [Planococcus sp. N064]WKA50335.1 adenosylcobinamide-phosphate synthase CbiB [Planococcus sp. N056]
MVSHILAIGCGLLLDRIIGDPPNWPHPVRWFGTIISKLTKKWNHGPHAFRNGFGLVAIVAASAFAASYLLIAGAAAIHWGFGFLVETVLIAAGLAQKSLRDAAEEVYRPLLHKNWDQAREKLSWIVGRDTVHLDESEITRGVVETVSENTSDGVTAPLFWAFLLGAPGLWLYKAVNTCDSMVGYKNEEFSQFGFASARLDDVLNFIPSRITGAIILLATRNKRRLTLRQRFGEWAQDARKHPSPNSGWLEAATAVQLGIQLGGVNTYKGIQSVRARMGTPVYALQARHIKDAVRHMHIATIWFFILFAIGGLIIELA